ncbi:hypothetical protein PINS_up008314 [Pythium insidiosum]|nr:hypothetical protein PINS_up008314 [Pythium insidiosum]
MEALSSLVALLVVALTALWWLVVSRRLRVDRAALEQVQHNGQRILRPVSTLPLLGNALDLARHLRDIHDWVYELLRASHGEPVLLQIPGRPDVVFVGKVEHFEQAFGSRFDAFIKGPFAFDTTRDFLGNGIFAVDHADWVHQRKTASHLFTARTIRDALTDTVRRHVVTLHRILQRSQENNERIDLFKLFNRFTIETFTEIAFGLSLECLESDREHPFQTAFDSGQRMLARRFLGPTWVWKLQRVLNIGNERQMRADLQVINDMVYDIIQQSLARRQRQESTKTDEQQPRAKDIVSLFLDNMHNTPDGVSQEVEAFEPAFLRDVVVNFLVAGRDTTAQALSWFFVCIARHPDVVAKIRDEIDACLSDRKTDDTPFTPEQVQQLVYLEAALRETLRLYPPVPLNPKQLAKDVVMSDGLYLREGSTVTLHSYALGRLEHVWGADATAFRPERWIDPDTKQLRSFSPFKFIAFHAGPRSCLGKNLALLEMKIVLATLLSAWDLAVQDADQVSYDFSLTFPIKGALLARPQRRPASD